MHACRSTLEDPTDFGSTSPASGLFNTATPATGSWVTSSGRYVATASSASVAAINLASVGTAPITPGSLLDITTTLKTSGIGGVVFDYQGPNYYKYVVVSADSNQIIVGHRSGSAWVTDATYAKTISTSTDYVLGVSLRGGLVNVSINNAVVLSHIYAETVTIGGYGLISRLGSSSGVTSFDKVEVKSDEAAYAPPPAPQHATAIGTQQASAGPEPTAAELDALFAEAKARWARSGLDAASLAKIDAATIQLADLPGYSLGEEVSGTVFIDIDAAGHGWFIDRTPGDDAEFAPEGGQQVATSADARGRVDLLSTIAHELGHVAGLQHTEGGVMGEDLPTGIRALPAAAARVDAAVPASPPATAPGLPAAPTVPAARPTAPSAGGLPFAPNGTSFAQAGFGAPPAAFKPTIDWNVSAPAPVAWRADVAAARDDDWQNDFLLRMGQTDKQRNPNLGLKLRVDLGARVAAPLRAL